LLVVKMSTSPTVTQILWVGYFHNGDFMAIPNRKPRRRVISMKSLVHAFDGNERPYPVYKFSDRQVFERPSLRPFALTTITPDDGTPGAATVGTPYTGTTWTASGGTAPYTFSVVAGALPPGLYLDPVTGEVTGTPTQIGVFAYTVEALGTPKHGIQVGSAASSITVS
jgi:hypothetical protein